MCRLAPSQATAVEFARRDLDRARAEDLGALGAAGLVLLVERLRFRLDEVLRVVDEMTREPG